MNKKSKTSQEIKIIFKLHILISKTYTKELFFFYGQLWYIVTIYYNKHKIKHTPHVGHPIYWTINNHPTNKHIITRHFDNSTNMFSLYPIIYYTGHKPHKWRWKALTWAQAIIMITLNLLRPINNIDEKLQLLL